MAWRRRLRVKGSDAAVIILNVYTTNYLVRAPVGVKGYLVKGSVEDDLIAAVRIVAAGKCFFARDLPAVRKRTTLANAEGGGADSYDLQSEKEILQLLPKAIQKEAAAILNVSPYTVETHRCTSCKLNCITAAKLRSTPCATRSSRTAAQRPKKTGLRISRKASFNC